MNKPSIDTNAANSNSKNNKQNRCRSFHFRYLELCRSKNVTPLAEIKSKNNSTTVLDVFGDKIGVTDWLLIVEALYSDQVLQTLGIRTRKSYGVVLDELDTEKKCKLFKQKPALYTKFVFSGIVEAISNSIQCNTNLKILNLEGLPLGENYIDTIAKAMASNESLKEVSFQRSNIYDKGCEAICNTMKYLENIEKINLSECGLTSKGAEAVADMIKMQKISRYTEGWQQSLRYREVDPNSIPGLRAILLSRNPQIDDDGVKAICEVLKEDVWIKVIELEACGLTDIGANLIIACLEVNNHITDFNVTGNKGINKILQRQIQDQLGKEDEERKAFEEHQQLINGVTSASLANKKVSMSLLKEKLKSLEEQLNFERVLRKKAEQLNERLNQQIQAYETQLEESANDHIPEGYVVVKNESLQSIIKERKELLEHLAAINHEKEQAATTQNTARTFRHQVMEINETPMDSISIVNLCDEFVEEQEIDEQQQQQHSKFTKVRKVKSEIKYMEPPAKVSSQKREPKSDHEFYSEAEFQQFSEVLYEGNIGDGLVNNVPMTQRSSPHTHRVEKKSVRYAASSGGGGAGNGGNCGGGDVADDYKQQQHHSSGNNNSNGYMGNYGHHMYSVHDGDIMTMANNFDMEELGLESTRSRRSEAGSTESDTIRNPLEQQQMKVFIKPKSAKKKAKAAREAAAAAAAAAAQQMYGESFDPTIVQKKDMMDTVKTSPRSLFWGLNEEE